MSNKWEDFDLETPELSVEIILKYEYQKYLFKNLVNFNDDKTFSLKFATDVYKEIDDDTWELIGVYVSEINKQNFKSFRELLENFKEQRVYEWVVKNLT